MLDEALTHGLPVGAEAQLQTAAKRAGLRLGKWTPDSAERNKGALVFAPLSVVLDGRLDPDNCYCVVVLDRPSYTDCLLAFRQGASDVIAFPFDSEIAAVVAGFRKKGAADRASRSLSEIESDAIRDVLDRCNGQMSRAARILGIGRSTLYRKVELYGLR